MLIIAVLFYILFAIQAPVWCYVFLGIATFLSIFSFGSKVGKLIKTFNE